MPTIIGVVVIKVALKKQILIQCKNEPPFFSYPGKTKYYSSNKRFGEVKI